MRALFFLLISMLSFSPNSFAGEWHKLDSQTLQFKGDINKDEFEKFQQAFDDKIDTMVVDSGGGTTTVGINIASVLVKRDITVIVDGICMSSCANYMFGVAKKKIIRNGVVGFHGNMSAFVKILDEQVESLKRSGNWQPVYKYRDSLSYLRFLMELKDVSDEETRAQYEVYVKAAAQEQEILKLVGLSQDFFDMTEQPDKGEGKGQFMMLLPLPATFAKYGFKNIEGEQNVEMIKTDSRLSGMAAAGWPYLVK